MTAASVKRLEAARAAGAALAREHPLTPKQAEGARRIVRAYAEQTRAAA